MEVKPGYKQSAAGVIPQDWLDHTVGELIDFEGGSQPDKSLFSPSLKPGFVRLIQIRDYKTDKFETYVPRDLARRFCTDNDVMIGRYGPPIFQILRGLAGAYNVALIKAKPRPEMSGGYAYYFLMQDKLFAFVDKLSQRSSGQTGIDLIELRAYPLPLPPTKAEQEAIAEALSDADALIEFLEQLLAKKRQLKQGAMQELLSGKKRLPGFGGRWDLAPFGDLLRHHSGSSQLIKGKLSNLPLADYFDAYSASGQDVWHDGFEHEGDALIVSAVGSRCGKTFRAHGKWSAIANTHVVWPNPVRVDCGFLLLFLDDESFWLKSGSGQPFVLFKQSFARTLQLPPLPEQSAIAGVLSDMAADIAALEAKLAKARNLKQGMMQELLTGRTRLPVDGQRVTG